MTDINQDDLQAAAERVADALPDDSPPVEDIADEMQGLVEYHIPLEVAMEEILDEYGNQDPHQDDDLNGGTDSEGQTDDPNEPTDEDQANDGHTDSVGATSTSSTTPTKVGDLDAKGNWVDLTVKVVELWDSTSDAVSQVGLLGDSSGTIKFATWATSDVPELDENTNYLLRDVVTDQYKGEYSVKLNDETDVLETDQEIEVGLGVEISGPLIDIEGPSGLIKRCPECSQVLKDDRCSEHGVVEGEFDLRVKGILDDGDEIAKVTLDREMTKQLTGIGLDTAIDMVRDTYDREIVIRKIAPQILGRYYSIQGPEINGYVCAERIDRQSTQPVSDLLDRGSDL